MFTIVEEFIYAQCDYAKIIVISNTVFISILCHCVFMLDQ